MKIFKIGANVSYVPQWCEGLGLHIHSGDSLSSPSFTAWQDPPAVYSYYVSSDGVNVVGSHHKYKVEAFKNIHKAYGSVYRVRADVMISFGAGDKTPTLEPIHQSFLYKVDEDIGRTKASELLEEAMLIAAKDMLKGVPDKRVAMLLSGGADSACHAQALLAAGATVYAYTIVKDAKSFDAVWSREHAKQLGVQYHEVIELPDSESMFKHAKIAALNTAAIDDCNLKMAAMTSLAMVHMPSDIKHVYHGHLSDAYFFNRGVLIGGFLKAFPEGFTGSDYCEYRWRTQSLGSTPQAAQIDAISRAYNKEWRGLFAHSAVESVMFGCGLAAIPAKAMKYILWEYLERHLPRPSWGKREEGLKPTQYAYGTGSGLMAAKDEYPYFKKENCGKLYPALLKALGAKK